MPIDSPPPEKPSLALVFEREGEVLVPRILVEREGATFGRPGWSVVAACLNGNEVLDESGRVIGVVGCFFWNLKSPWHGAFPDVTAALAFFDAANGATTLERDYLQYAVALEPTAEALARVRERAQLQDALSGTCGAETLYGTDDAVFALETSWSYEWEDEAAGLLRVGDAPGKMVFARALQRWEP